MSYLFDSSATLNFGGAVSSVTLQGSLANQMVIANDTSFTYSFHDPMSQMLDAIYEIAFRASSQAGQDNATATKASQTSPYQGQGLHTIYVTNKTYMSLAAVIGFLSVVAVGFTLWGWWELGRQMSLSPLEIAKAFDAPLLRQAGSNVRPSQMTFSSLERRIQYGEVRKDGGAWAAGARQESDLGTSLGISEDAKQPRRRQFLRALDAETRYIKF